MVSPVGSLIIGFQSLISISIILILFFVFLFYISGFLETKTKKYYRIVHLFSILSAIIAVFLVFTSYPMFYTIVALINALYWVYITYNTKQEFSFMNKGVVWGFFITLFAHFLWMMHFLEVFVSPYRTASVFFAVIWPCPLLVMCGMLQHYGTGKKGQKRGFWNHAFSDISRGTMEMLKRRSHQV